MRIALSAPADLRALAEFCGQNRERVASGLGSTATTPLIVEFLRRGHEVTLYTLSKDVAEAQRHCWGNLRVFVGPFRGRHLGATYFCREIGFLRRTIEADAPPFVHAHWTYEFALGALRSGVPTLTTIHDLPWNVLRYYRDPFRAVRLLMAYEVGLRGRHFTAVSESAASHFQRHIRRSAPVAVIPNGLPDAVFDMGRHPHATRCGGLMFATLLQGWSRRKNAKAALEAFGLVRRQIPDVQLTMFGSGYEDGGDANQWATKRNLQRNVIFAGPLPHADLLQRVCEKVDVVLHPSLDEAFSMAALEALALHKSLIAGETTPGMREMLGSGGGVLVDVGNPASMAQAMFQLATNADYRHHLATRSFERAFRLYRLGTVASAYEAIYDKMMRTEAPEARVLDLAAASSKRKENLIGPVVGGLNR